MNKTHTITAKIGTSKTTVFIVEDRTKGIFWWVPQGAHMVHKSNISYLSRALCTGNQLNNLPDVDVFTYYGDGTTEHPDNVADMETLLWLLRD